MFTLPKLHDTEEKSVEFYNVTIINGKTGAKNTIKVRSDEIILDVAVTEGVELPYSCSAGACTSCTAKLLDGEVNQDHNFLKPEEEAAGFILACKCYPKSDCTIVTHQEDALLDL
jgi:ferredoxin